MNTRRKACREVCPKKSRADRLSCWLGLGGMHSSCLPWKDAFKRLEGSKKEKEEV
jgi:hypothetical protein